VFFESDSGPAARVAGPLPQAAALPVRATAGVECRLNSDPVDRFGAYRFRDARDATLTYFERLELAPLTTGDDARGPNVRVGGWDPGERLKDQAYDSISAEVLYPTRGAAAWVTGDPELEEACCRAYNDWLIEFCSAAPQRLWGLAMISLWNPPPADPPGNVNDLEAWNRVHWHA
jgi:hypothetical protein